jgi:hypothetical protein
MVATSRSQTAIGSICIYPADRCCIASGPVGEELQNIGQGCLDLKRDRLAITALMDSGDQSSAS